jgi:RNA polymerase-binding transcription factor DksA
MQNYDESPSNLIEMLEELDDQLAKITRTIEKPLAQALEAKAMNKDQYGLCQVCRKPISEERLKVVPYSRLCIKCNSQAGC